MTKQEELAELRELKAHYQSIEGIEQEIRRTRSAFDAEVDKEVDRRAPNHPKKPEFLEQEEKNISKNETSKGTPVYFGVILAFLHMMGMIILCIIYNNTGYVGNNASPFVFFVVLGFFQFPAVAFLIRFITMNKASGIAGYVVLCAISMAPAADFLEESAAIATYLMIGLPAVILILALVLKLLHSLRAKAKIEQEKADRCHAEARYKAAFARAAEEREQIKSQVLLELQHKKTATEQACATLQKDVAAHRTAIDTATILHREFHGSLDYIIRLMETGMADSIKEALRIKRAEDQESGRLMGCIALDPKNPYKKPEEDRRWIEERERWERYFAQAALERERERIEQAKRAADELEEIRKKLEND